MQPFKLIQEAIKAVPAMRYALGVAGIVAVVALVATFRLDPKVAVFGAIITLGLMVALVIFAKLSTIAPKYFLKPVLVMMWAFLVLVIAQAALLFSAVSFKQPKPLYDWLFSSRPEPPSNDLPLASEIAPEILQAARQQCDAADCAGAWKQIEAGLKAAPNSTAGLRLQAEIAMKWLRRSFGSDHRELVDMLSPCLYRAANSSNTNGANATWAGDIRAHIGWGNYLKSQAGPDLDFEGFFKQAVALDFGNTFGHTMWGYCLIWGGERPPAFKAARSHFDVAAQSSREREYVRELQLAALGSRRVLSEHVLDFIPVVNEVRKAGDALSDERRRKILGDVYWSEWKPVLNSINSAQAVLPAAEHLALLKWLIEDIKNRTPHPDFFIARLTEQAGDRAEALRLYRALTLIQHPGPGYGDLEKDIREGINRCSR